MGTFSKPVILTAAVAVVLAGSLIYSGHFLGASASSVGSSGNTTSNATDATNMASDAPDRTARQNAANASDNAARRLVVQQGTLSSPGPDAGPFQIVDILPAREDGRVYEGTITFTATKPVMVAPLLRYGVADEVLEPEFGDLFVFPGGPQGSLIAPALITPDYGEEVNSDIPMPRTYSASVPFTANGLSIGNLEGEQFLVTYSLHATLFRPQLTDDVQSAIGQPEEVNGTRVSIVNGSAFLEDTAYDPNPVTVAAGQNVTWINDDLDPHTVTSGAFGKEEAGEQFDSGYMGPHRSFSHMFEEEGEYQYFCEIHPNMVGVVMVETVE
jgi:plastocyanin